MPRGKMTVMGEIPHGRPLAVDNKAKKSDLPYFREVLKIETDRWGVWGVGFRLPMNSRELSLY